MFDRALHGISIGSNDGLKPFSSGGVLDHDGWYVTKFTRQKFRASPPLGGEFVVTGKLVEALACGTREVWDMEMTNPPSEVKEIMYCSALVTISKPDSVVPPDLLPLKPGPFEGGPGVTVAEQTYTPYRDEYDFHLGSTHLPLQSALNLFERARTDYLGGPDALRQLKDKHNLIAVVTGIDKCELVNLGHKKDERDEEEADAGCRPGEAIAVKTYFLSKRRGRVIECRQTLLVSGTKRRRRLAQGIVTIMILEADTRRPAKSIPKWLKEL